MKITIDKNRRAQPKTMIIGVCGEIASRTIEVVSPDIDGATLYVMRFELPSGIVYETEINDSAVVIPAAVLAEAGCGKMQWVACSSTGQFIAKSSIIGYAVMQSLSDETSTLPAPEDTESAIERINKAVEEGLKQFEGLEFEDGNIQEVIDARKGSISQRTFPSLAARLSTDFDLCITQGELEKALSSVTTAYTTADKIQNALLLTAMGLAKGSKNLLKNTASSTTKNGLTFTVNDDGSVTVNGTATADTEITVRNMTLLANTDYILSGCPASEADEWQYRMYAINTSTWAIAGADYGYGSDYTLSTGNNTGWSFRIQIKSGCTADDLVFYPMLRYAEIADDTYEPYTPSLQEQINALTSAVEALGGTVSTTNEEV